MNKRNRLAVGLVAGIFMLACACPATSLPAIGNEAPTAAPFPTSAPIISTLPALPPSAPTGDVFYSDDFSVTSAEMETFSDENGSTETRDGVYILRATGDLWHWGRSNSEFDNTVIAVDMKMITGPSNDNAGFGVICRLTEREDTSIDGYMLAISADGYYTIRSIAAGSMSPLVDWSYSDVVNQGTETNRIRATCNGSDLSLEVNGETIATATAAGGSTSGSIAFTTISFEDSQPFVEIHFDNLVVSKP
ncbi:MAG: hypothetical protein Q8L87_09050 [Anaerolineales bacterium]|jgi:hypothetical protein|nr:hypothetical protein [Anaerolineales bacterium]